jgi:predicted enzyme related to lactoylglutathione lyase
MSITGVIIRRLIDDLPAAVPFYEALTGEPAHRFSYGGVELAAVGPFLLIAAGDNARRAAQVAATIAVDDLAATERLLLRLGAEIVAPRAATPNGHRLIARHPDGAVFEYVGRQGPDRGAPGGASAAG